MSIEHILSIEDLSYIHNHEEVLAARDTLGSSRQSYFQIGLTDSIRESLNTHLNLDLSKVDHIPMRWIQGDTLPHADSGRSAFEHTHLVYLSDSPGEFIIGDQSYPIKENTGFIFDEGLVHKTVNTGSQPRLLLGPMNEFAQPVGGPTIFFYSTYADALAIQNGIFDMGGYIIPDPLNNTFGQYDTFISAVNGVTHWSIAPTVPNTPTGVYANGYDLTSITYDVGIYGVHLYPASAPAQAPCFLEGTEILCQVDGAEKYLPIESLTPGTLVKTSRHGYKKVVILGSGKVQNPGHDERIEKRLYKCSPENYSELVKDVYLTGRHAILVDNLTTAEFETTMQTLGKIYTTDDACRLLTWIDERAKPWASIGSYTVWNIALEHDKSDMNYGVYASGLLVESCSIYIMQTNAIGSPSCE
uniref:Hedgehog/Intein (Hint) domain-containing protein n=1 Tax=viral metagenome TaxID=1070528 RepID=A0A6C0L9K5_9ZZZZ